MIIVYTPAEGEPEHYDARTLLVSEASIVARTIDMKWADIKSGLSDDDLDAMRGVAWVLKKRGRPTLRFTDFDPNIEELTTRMDKREVRDYVEGTVAIAAQDPEVTGEQIAHALRNLPAASFDPEHCEAVIKELTAAPKGEGQAPESEPPSPEADGSPNSTSMSGDARTSLSSDTS